MATISKRGGFSDRNGIRPENVVTQLNDFDKRTRIQLHNMISEMNNVFCRVVIDFDPYDGRQDIQNFYRYVLGSVYSEPVDSRFSYKDDSIIKMINDTILNGDYDEILTLIEALIQYWDSQLSFAGRYHSHVYSSVYHGNLFKIANSRFEDEYIGYRFVDGIIVPISDRNEIETIQEALNNKYKPVYEHISKANKLLADREHPDFENSIKESISAVEAICEILTGAKYNEATLSKMLKKLEENGVVIHSALKSAFNTLYGYTSDANGIRHAGDIGGPASTFEEAKFMLVACCAFINYLTAQSAN